MTISQEDLDKIARLAHLDIHSSNSANLAQEVSSIMDFVAQLRTVNTSMTTPLFHPFGVHQRLREDVVTEEDCTAELEAMASMFEDNLYLVPKVLESGK